MSNPSIIFPLSLQLQGVSKELFSFRPLSDLVEQPRELMQALRLGAMVIGKAFNLSSQNGWSRLVPIEVLKEVFANISDLA